MAIINFPRTPQQRIDGIRFTCSCCRKQQRGLMDLAKIKPDIVFLIPEEERAARAKITSDLCSIEDKHFLVRAVLEIPIRETDAYLGYGVWGSLSETNFNTYVAEYDNPAPAFGPFFSWLGSSLPSYPGLDEDEPAAALHFRGDNQRPLMILAQGDHPLAIDQHEGITVDRLAEIYAAWGHTALL